MSKLSSTAPVLVAAATRCGLRGRRRVAVWGSVIGCQHLAAAVPAAPAPLSNGRATESKLHTLQHNVAPPKPHRVGCTAR